MKSQFLDLAALRYSCRSYENRAIAPEVVELLLEAVRLAPSAVNYQPYRFYVVSSQEGLQAIRSCYPRAWFKNFPLCIVACGIHSQGWHRADGKDHTDIDVAIAVEHLVLAAADQGLGSCWVCNFQVEKLTQYLQLEEGVEPVAMIPLGYPDEAKVNDVLKRKPVNEWVQYR